VGVEFCACGRSKLETRRENLAQPHIPSFTALCEINKPSLFGKQHKIAEKILKLTATDFDLCNSTTSEPPQSHASRSTCISNDDEETWLSVIKYTYILLHSNITITTPIVPRSIYRSQLILTMYLVLMTQCHQSRPPFIH
jgi:hypothetical protein